MVWKFDNDRAIYIQIVEQFKQSILSGEYEKGAKIEPVRDLSKDAGVNPNTMQKALCELEREGFMYTTRTSGRYVTEDESIIENAKKEFADKTISQFLDDMKKLGYDKVGAIDLLRKYETEAQE